MKGKYKCELNVNEGSKALSVLRYEQATRNMDFYWKMKNGELIKVKDMSDGHLDNTIKMLQRQKLFYEALFDLDPNWDTDEGWK